MDVPILEELQRVSLSPQLRTLVSDFISNQQWSLPARFYSLYPHIAQKIHNITLPLQAESDCLIWEHSSSGVPSFSDGYELVRQKSNKKSWATSIWNSFIPPRYSLLAWRIFYDRLPTDLQLQRHGVTLVSKCPLCSLGCVEDSVHLFFNCSFAQHIWQWLACCFGTSLPSQGSLDDFWNVFIGKRFSSQLANVWLATGLFTLMQIWKVRNKLVFDNKQPSLWRVLCSIKSWVRFAAPYFPGSSKGLLDVNILKDFGVQPIIQQVRIPRMVRWLSPTHSWIKLNTDGLAKGNPGAAACGGIFRISGGRYVGGYCQNLGFQNAFYSELMAVIIGVEFAYQFGWHTLWLESDSMGVIEGLRSSTFKPPWPLRVHWHNCLSRLNSMQYYCSHIHREGNSVADCLANLGLAFPSLCWLPTPPMEIFSKLRNDALGVLHYR